MPNKKYISFLHPTVIQSIPGYKKTHLMELTFSREGHGDGETPYVAGWSMGGRSGGIDVAGMPLCKATAWNILKFDACNLKIV